MTPGDAVRLPRRLAAPRPGWVRRADVLVVGSGVAGLTAALGATRHGRVLLVTKARLDDGSTRWAQGGIAAALGLDDSPADHAQDTLVAGVGLCDTDAVEVLVTEGPARVRELIGLGAAFDPDPARPGNPALTREGGHLRRRILHAGGDATGAEVQRALIAAVRAAEAAGRLEVLEHAMVLDLLLEPAAGGARAVGATLHVLGEGSSDGVGAALAPAVVLATGGMGQIFASTTNPGVSTGDGVAAALRAGAAVTDLEFVQFHPTALWLGAGSRGQQPLVSEALRGEGAFLVDATGSRVIDTDTHPLADLAPRDVVAKAMSRRMRALGTDHLFLDARGLGAEQLAARFPTITASCLAIGVDPAREPIPVAPAAHYASGGVRTDLSGRTEVPGLYACGEVACTGVHGANRLASNSLLEGLVFAARIAAAVGADGPAVVAAVPAQPAAAPELVDPAARDDLTAAMAAGAGVLRSADSLADTREVLAKTGQRHTADVGPAGWEATDLHTVASLLVAAAERRTETRGAHWRADHPEADPGWRLHQTLRLAGDDATGVLTVSTDPVR